MNADLASKTLNPRGRAYNGRAKTAWIAADGLKRRFTLAGLKQQHDDQDTPSNWRDPPRPAVKGGGARSHITGDNGKLAEDERELEGSIVARKRSNVRGAKGPCCLQ